VANKFIGVGRGDRTNIPVEVGLEEEWRTEEGGEERRGERGGKKREDHV